MWAWCRGTSTGTFTSALTIMQAVVSLEIDIGISPINLRCLIVGLGFSFVSLICFLIVASEDTTPPAVNSSISFISTMDFADGDRGGHNFWLGRNRDGQRGR